MQLLTKSKYLMGLQCPKLLWIQFNEPDRMPPVDDATQALFDQGHEVGEYATKLFDGVDLSKNDFMGNIRATKDAVSKKQTIFEAGIKSDKLYSRVDILKPNGDAWDIIEVKSGTSVKDVNLHDVAFQKHCLEQSGLKIKNCTLMHINRDYVRDGDIDPAQLFTLSDITSDVDVASIEIKGRIEKLFEIINSPAPDIDIGPFCRDPYECNMIDECWDMPNGNVFELYRGGKKSFDLFNQGVNLISDIPTDYELTNMQNIQKQAIDKPFVDIPKLTMFLHKINEPVSYLDFETFMTAIPLYDGTRPYQQIPFQYSLHVQENDKLVHHEFLSESGDPRKRFLESLKQSLPEKGSILAYFAGFEISRLKELAKEYPEYDDFVKNIISRIVDLIEPFNKFYYYNSAQHGSASLKAVLPAITGKGYEDLDVTDGQMAARLYSSILKGKVKDKEVVINDLYKYCERDTLAMVWIVDKLKKMI